MEAGFNPRDARAFAEGVLAASAQQRDRAAKHEHHTSEAEEAKRHAGWLTLCSVMFLTTAFTAESWWMGVTLFLAGLALSVATFGQIKAWRTHSAKAAKYETEG